MQKWSQEGDNSLWLITPDEFDRIPDGTKLECINGQYFEKGKDEIDLDTRFGHIAYGVRNPFNHELKDLFLIFKLCQ